MQKTLYLLAAAALVAAPVAQAQDGPAVFKPTGGWTADYGEDYCRLIRTFSDGKEQVSLAMERTQPGTPVRLILVGDGVKVFRSADEIGYSFLPSGSSAKTRFSRSETTEGNQYLNLDPVTLAPAGWTGPTSVVRRQVFSQNAAPPTNVEPAAFPVPPLYDRAAEQETARAITAIELSEGLTSPSRIETGSLRAPIVAMQNCADDLLKVWGLDPDKHKTLTAVAFPNPKADGILPQGTIPFSEFSKFSGGANQVRLLIGADGKPTSCTIYAPSLSESLNNKICSSVMERASFQPAKDADGQPIASYWMGPPFVLGPAFSGPGR